VPTRVGPLTRRGGRPDIFLAGDTGAAAPAVFFAVGEATAVAKHLSRLRQRRLPEGCVSVSGASSNDRQTASSPLASSQPSCTPRSTAQQSARSSLSPTL